jgi:hypothetical protein
MNTVTMVTTVVKIIIIAYAILLTKEKHSNQKTNDNVSNYDDYVQQSL